MKKDKAYLKVHKMVLEIFMYSRKMKYLEDFALSGLI